MDVWNDPSEFVSMASIILLLLLSVHRALSLPAVTTVEDDYCEDVDIATQFHDTAIMDVNSASRSALLHFCMFSALAVIDEDLGFWIKPRSTTWFSRFLLEEYDNERWVQLFCMTKQSVFSLAHLLSPHIRRMDTKYRAAVPVIVRLACVLFKLGHGASFLICSEMFAIGRSTVSIVLKEVVRSINVVLKKEITWPSGERLAQSAADFKTLCGLPGVVGAIDGTHIAIKKPQFASADYYYFKSGGFSINCQAVVDSSKRFLDLYVGMPGSTNDARMLRRSTLFRKGQANTLWTGAPLFNGFSPYLLGDAGFPLLPWLMVPHRRVAGLAVADELFNRRLSKGRAVVENAFAMLKMTFRELQQKCVLDVGFVPQVVTACALLHNVLLQQSHDDVQRLLQILQTEGYQLQQPNDMGDAADVPLPTEVQGVPQSHKKRRDLGVYLSL